MIFLLRAHRDEDLQSLYEIDQACYEPGIAYSRSELREYLQFPGAECVVAEANTKLIGFCVAARKKLNAHIITIDVLNPYRRLGVGTALLSRMEEKLADKGARIVQLETAVDNYPGITFWHKHGYRAYGVLKKYYAGRRDAFAMAKTIAPVSIE